MASSNSPYNWYTRYRVLAADMTNNQNLFLGNTNALSEGLLNGSVLSGFEAATGGAMTVSVASGIAQGPSGYLHVVNSISSVTPTAPTGSFPARSLVVARPLLTNTNPMTNPTNPFETVYLNTLYGSQVTLLPGTAASAPAYPSIEPNDVVLFGIRTFPGQTAVSIQDIDFTVRDDIGKNAALLQDVASYDSRLKPYRFSSQVIGIKPSQYGGGGKQKQFKPAAQNKGSIFPKTPAGAFNYNDTFVNFQTGVINGGDGLSGTFTPSFPTSGNCIVATVSLNSNSTISVTYGTTGTRAQCFSAIENQNSVGAGAINVPTSGQLIAFVVITSSNGTTVTEIDVIDARGILQGSGASSGLLTTNNLDSSTTVASGQTMTWPNLIVQTGQTFSVSSGGGYIGFNSVTVQGTGVFEVLGTGEARII